MRDYDGAPMREVLLDRLPSPPYPNFLVYVMGPYTKFELEYVLSGETDPEAVEADLGAFTDADREFITELEELCSDLRDDPGVNAFIATDPDIPLPEDEDAKEPTLNAIAQSKAFAEAIDILPALTGEDSPKGIFRLRVSSVLKYAFAWNVEGRHRVVTNGVLSSACSPVNGAFLPAYSGRQRRLAIQPAR